MRFNLKDIKGAHKSTRGYALNWKFCVVLVHIAKFFSFQVDLIDPGHERMLWAVRGTCICCGWGKSSIHCLLLSFVWVTSAATFSQKGSKEYRCGSYNLGRLSALACSRCCRRRCKCKWLWRALSRARIRGFASAPGNMSWMGQSCRACSWSPSPPSRTRCGSWRTWNPWSQWPTAGLSSQTPRFCWAGPGWRTRCPGPWSYGGRRRWRCRCHDRRSFQWSGGWA